MKYWLYIQLSDLSWSRWASRSSLTEIKKDYKTYAFTRPNKEGVIWGISPMGTPVKVVKE